MTESTRAERPAARLRRLWQSGRPPEIDAFLAEVGALDVRDLADVLRVDQSERWRAGTPIPAEEYLRRFPAVAANAETAVDLIHNEFVLAERHGRAFEPVSFISRFPAHADTLRLQIDLHQAVALPTATRPTQGRPAADVALPGSFGRYQILRLLGRGGMGAVYEAYDPQLDRRVALKVPKFGPSDQDGVDRFLREARIAARFNDPHLCPVYDAGEVDGTYYLTMPVVEGETLADRLQREGPLPPQKAIELATTLARAMATAHEAGVVHRDLKPSNIMIDRRGTAVIMDFGLARRPASTDAVLTTSGVFVGSPAYAAPEQVLGSPATIPADVYALGGILYECLTGRPPFVGRADEVMRRKVDRNPDPPSRLAPAVSSATDRVCLQALNRTPDARFPSMQEFAAALADIAPPPSTDRQRRRGLLAAIGVLVVSLVAVGVAVWGRSGQAPPTEPDRLPNESIWTGEYSFVPNDLSSWRPALLIVTHRDGSRFEGRAETDDGDFAWNVEGTLDGDRIQWQYVKIIREKQPTHSVESGAATRGQCNGQSIDVDYFDPGDSSQAAIRLRRTDRDIRAAKVRADRAWEFNDSGNLDAAIDVCSLALKLDDRCLPALICRGNALIKKRSFAAAIEELDRAIAIDPASYQALVDRAWAWNALREHQKALVDADRALQLNSTIAEGYYQRGAAHAGNRKFQQAIDDFSSAIRLRANYAWAYYERGKAYKEMGNMELAAKDFAKAREHDPSLSDPD